jgi:hypothetical protein
VSTVHFVDPASRLVVTTCTGEVSRIEVETSLTKLRRHPDFKPDFRQLADLSLVSRLDLHFVDMETIYHGYDPFSNEAKRAVVAPDNGATYGLARMYQSIVNSAQFEVFQLMLDAITWLGLEATILQAACKRNLSNLKSFQLREGLVMDLPPGAPKSFRVLRKPKGKTSGA